MSGIPASPRARRRKILAADTFEDRLSRTNHITLGPFRVHNMCNRLQAVLVLRDEWAEQTTVAAISLSYTHFVGPR